MGFKLKEYKKCNDKVRVALKVAEKNNGMIAMGTFSHQVEPPRHLGIYDYRLTKDPNGVANRNLRR